MSTHPSNKQDEYLDEVFTHHPPKDEQTVQKYRAIRSAAREFAQVVVDNCPPCADRTVAIRKIRGAVFVANASIALKPQEREEKCQESA